MKKLSLLLALLLACGGLLLSGCASSAPRPAAAPARPGDRFSGQYEGRWWSVSGHHGRLTCTFTRVDASHYQAHFTAWWSVFHTSYDTVFNTREGRRELRFSGEQELGKLRGGLYHYEGRVAGREWRADYRATEDRGGFAMSRR